LPGTLIKEDKEHAKKVCSLLMQIKNHHRNLIMHPEFTLNENDAISLLHIITGAIETMEEKL